MTERKPAGMSFTSWIDQQINEAAERGAFDDLPGAGKPLPKRGGLDDGQAWIRDYARREGVPADELLPTPLRLRKEIERLTEAAPFMRSERQVREVIADLNHRILEWRRIPLGPAVFVPLVDAEAMITSWRDAHAARPAAASPAEAHRRTEARPATSEAEPARPARPRWRYRLSRHRRRRAGPR